MDQIKNRYNQLGVVSDFVLVIFVLFAFVLGLLVCKAFA